MPANSTIFIVDDDAGVRESLVNLLDSVGLKAESYGSAEAFLKSYDPARYGCVLLDIMLPDMSGLELQKQLTEAAIDLPVIMMTGFGDVSLAVQAMKAGAADFIEKPFDQDAIVDCVRRVLTPSESPQEAVEPANPLDERIANLTPRERDVLDQLVIGRPNKIIAFELGLSPRTVEHYRARIMDKMGAKSLSHLVRMALAAGIDPEGLQ